MRHKRRGILVGLLGMAAGATLMLVGAARATDPQGLSLFPLGRATLDAFFLLQSNFGVISPEPTDVVMGELRIEGGGHTGWHTHPGPTFATVALGQVELTIVNEDGSCTTSRFGPGEGFSEGGGIVHIARNVGNTLAVVYVTFHAVPPDIEDIIQAIIDWSPPTPTGPGCDVVSS
jgi:quercetin dioxygenase-like cupin family protein